jgi:glycosyltransferase involved in cell wall biosynthesis
MREAAEKSPYIDPESWPKSPVDTDYLEWLNANIDVAMVRYHELAPYVEHHFEDVVYVPRAVDCDRIQPEEFGSTDAIHIAHAPSNREVKGTEFLEDAVHDLQSEGHNIALEIIEGKHDEVVRQLQRADIVVDQLRIGTFGNLALEAMATETPVVCYLRDDLRDKYPDSLPIVNGTPNDIQEVLRDLITDQTRRKALGEAGREYVLAHHRLSLVGRKLANLYETL